MFDRFMQTVQVWVFVIIVIIVALVLRGYSLKDKHDPKKLKIDDVVLTVEDVGAILHVAKLDQIFITARVRTDLPKKSYVKTSTGEVVTHTVHTGIYTCNNAKPKSLYMQLQSFYNSDDKVVATTEINTLLNDQTDTGMLAEVNLVCKVATSTAEYGDKIEFIDNPDLPPQGTSSPPRGCNENGCDPSKMSSMRAGPAPQ